MSGEGTGGPQFSVLVPSYNRSRYVVEALEGVRSQDFTDYELIIIDDASRDDSVAVIERWLAATGRRSQFIRHSTNAGVVAVFNEFAGLARGRYLSWCACDDVWLPGRLARHARAFAQSPDDVAIVCGNCVMTDADGRARGLLFEETFEFPQDPYAALLSLERIFIATPNCALRKSCVDAVGRWSTRYLQEDFDMYLRLTERYRVVFQPQAGVQYRQLDDSFGHDPKNTARFSADTLRVLMDRKPRNEREAEAIARGKARLLELAYAYTRKTGSPASNADLRQLIAGAGDGNAWQRLVATSVRANIPFGAYWIFAKAVRRLARLMRAGRRAENSSTAS